MHSPLRHIAALGIVTSMIAVVAVTVSPIDARALSPAWNPINWFRGDERPSEKVCDTGLRCSPTSVDPAGICGEGKTPVFADPVSLKSYGECTVQAMPGQCHACVLVFAPKKPTITTPPPKPPVAQGTKTPPAEGYECRGISTNDKEIPADCKALGMKGTRCAEGFTMRWYGQINPEKSGCPLSDRCSGRWGKCEQEKRTNPQEPPAPKPVEPKRPDAPRPPMQTQEKCGDDICSANEKMILCVDPPPTGPVSGVRYGCFPLCPQDCEKKTPPADACGDGICSEIENAIRCPMCTQGTPREQCACARLCPRDCGPVEPPKPPTPVSGCGDNICDQRTENAVSCSKDCKSEKPRCGDTICQKWVERSSVTPAPEGCLINPQTGTYEGVCTQVCAIDCDRQTTPPSNPTPPRNPTPPSTPPGKTCVSSVSYDSAGRPFVGPQNCPLEQHCSTENGVCNRPPECAAGGGCMEVCTGTCVAD